MRFLGIARGAEEEASEEAGGEGDRGAVHGGSLSVSQVSRKAEASAAISRHAVNLIPGFLGSSEFSELRL